ncbi:MAG: winged helix-turn-helix domain-containing protein [Anaerolineae bacterium]
MRISLDIARRIALRAQMLDCGDRLPAGREGVAQAIEHLGYVQIDSLAVVERAHHHTLWARVPCYQQSLLDELQATDRRIFEYWHWADVAAYLPLDDYVYHAQRMRDHARTGRVHDWLEENAALVKEMLNCIRAEGPLGAAAFQAPPDWERGSWWHWKPAKRALEYLFTAGTLMVSGRRNFQRLYDLPERVLPAELPPPMDAPGIPREELARAFLRRTLASQGIVSLQGGFSAFLLRHGRKAVTEALRALEAEGEVLPVEIEGLDGRTFYIAAAAPAEATAEVDGCLHILSPFDSMVISRTMLSQLFGFEYRLGSYTAVAKRTRPHFAVPVLYGDRFVAQIDTKAERQARILRVRNVLFEEGAWPSPGLAPALAARLADFAAFNGCDTLILERTEPQEALPVLLEALAAQ